MTEKLSEVGLCSSTKVDDRRSRVEHFIAVAGVLGEFLVQRQLTDLHYPFLLLLVEVSRRLREPHNRQRLVIVLVFTVSIMVLLYTAFVQLCFR